MLRCIGYSDTVTDMPDGVKGRRPYRSQRRNTISTVNCPGWATPIRSKAPATSGHEPGSGQKPVDWLLTSANSTQSPSAAKIY